MYNDLAKHIFNAFQGSA